MLNKPDLTSRADLARLVDHFYLERVIPDPIIGFYFTQIRDITGPHWPEHRQRLIDFWARQLLGELGPASRTFEVHQQLHRQIPLTGDHFHRWLYLFRLSVDALFDGAGAEAAKQRAALMAASIEQGLSQG